MKLTSKQRMDLVQAQAFLSAVEEITTNLVQELGRTPEDLSVLVKIRTDSAENIRNLHTFLQSADHDQF